MTNHVSRRNILRLGAAAAVLPWLPSFASAAATAATPMATALAAAAAVRPFKLSDVSLGQGVFASKRELMLDYARGYDVNRLPPGLPRQRRPLHRGAVRARGGWEGLDGEANGNLRGHYTGHFLTCCPRRTAAPATRFRGQDPQHGGALNEAGGAAPTRHAGRAGSPRAAAEIVRGSYQYVDLPARLPRRAAAITLAAWVRPTTPATGPGSSTSATTPPVPVPGPRNGEGCRGSPSPPTAPAASRAQRARPAAAERVEPPRGDDRRHHRHALRQRHRPARTPR